MNTCTHKHTHTSTHISRHSSTHFDHQQHFRSSLSRNNSYLTAPTKNYRHVPILSLIKRTGSTGTTGTSGENDDVPADLSVSDAAASVDSTSAVFFLLNIPPHQLQIPNTDYHSSMYPQFLSLSLSLSLSHLLLLLLQGCLV